MARIDEISAGVYRIASFDSRAGITFNQYLLVDDEPLLFQTGRHAQFDDTLEAVRRVIDPVTLR
jgi:flavorubredoxin